MLRLIACQAIRHSAKFRQVPQLVIRQKHAERIIPSIVQLQEDSVEFKLGSEATALEIVQLPTINIGDYVEVFRAGQRSGMVVGQRKMSGRLQMLTILLRNGRIYTSRSDHVAFVIPSFHKLPEVTKICPQGLSPEINSEGILQTIPVEYQRAITRYQSLVRANKAIAFPRLERLYTQFSQSSSNTVSLNDLTAYAFQTTNITSLQRHVTFSYLAADNVHFTPTNNHTAARTRNGAIAFASPSPVVRILDNLDLPPLRFSKPEYASHLPPIQVSLDKSLFSPARLMVAETMIIGGRIASKYARDNGVNIIYRGQQWRPDSSPEDLRKREELYAARDPITGFVRYQDMIKVRAALPPATFGTTPDQPHVIMGIMDGYTKATSPLRRYGDLIIHWQLKASLLKEKEPFSKDYLDKLLPALEARTKQLSGLQQQSQRFWIMQLLQRMNVDGFLNTMEWDCIIAADNRVALNELGGAIEVADATLLDLGIPIRIDKLKRNVQVGEIAKVRICSVDEGRISAQMIE
ncbi:hypothetical protein RMCBS344292_06109 [Rhizopus microsporus]|nr:hypothetical protein RMCBS344292_06109 [Rhizopus microsporus]